MMTTFRPIWLPAKCALSSALPLFGCGASIDGSGPGETTVDTWRDYCVATMTEDYVVIDPFGEVDFTVQSGDEYLVSSLATDRASLIYIAATGPYPFEVQAEPGRLLPFTTPCQAGATMAHLAVFSDITVYAELERTTEICRLTAGSARPRDPMGGFGHVLNGINGHTIFEIYLNDFGADCGGAELGYVEVPSTWLFDATTWLSPINLISGPI